MRWTTLFSLSIVLILLAGCFNAGYGTKEKAEQPEKEDANAGDIGEQGLLDILDEAEKSDKAEEQAEQPAEKEDAEDDDKESAEDSADESSEEDSEESIAAERPAEKGLIRKEITSDITVTEGQVVEIKLKAYDPDGDKLVYTYGKPLDQNGRWQTKVGDEGVHSIDVVASDGKSRTVKTITVRVTHKNRSPIIEPLQKIVVNEGDTISLAPRVKDPEGTNIKVAFSGWMTEARKKTGYDDAGTYRVTITVSDGEFDATSYVDIEVRDVNRAPVFEAIVG